MRVKILSSLVFILWLTSMAGINNVYAEIKQSIIKTNKTQAQQENGCTDIVAAAPFTPPPPEYLPKYYTVVHKLLDVEKSVADVTPMMYSIMDSLIDEARISLHKPPKNLNQDQARLFAEDALKTIDCILLRHGFVYPGHGAVQLLSDGLGPTMYKDGNDLLELKNQAANIRRRAFINARGNGPFYVVDCDIGSYLYIAIAQVMDYPLQLVDIPNHNFVRWELGSGQYLNYETMEGFATDDNYYLKNWQIPKKFAGKAGILLSMNDQEMMAYHDASVAMAWSWKHNYEKMIEYYLRSISMDPTRALSFNNLAWYYSIVPKIELRDGKKAVSYAQKSASLLPTGDEFDTLACAHAQAGDFKTALAMEKKAVAVGYSPDGSEISEHIKLFSKQKTCEDSSFDADTSPFRPRQ